MKKLLYTLLAVSIIFSACEEDVSPNSNNNNNSGNSTNLAIGDSHQGGIIFYLNANGGGLIAAPTDQSGSGEATDLNPAWAGDIQWGCDNTDILGAEGSGMETGNQNTIDIEAGCATPNTAADLCANLTISGYSDWFLPSKAELNEMYLNKDIIGGFFDNYYWSSTEVDSENAWQQKFYHAGTQRSYYKDDFLCVRAIRAF